MTGKIRMGILGAAKIAPWAVVLPSRRRDDVQVTCIAARDRGRADVFAAEYNVPNVAADYRSLIARNDVDLIYVALPVAAHAEWTIRALEAGKHVLCEKPFATSALEARQMVDAAVRADRVLLEAIHYRFHNVTRRAEDWIRSGRLGVLCEAEAIFVYPVPYRAEEIRWHKALGGGASLDNGTYAMHVLRTVLAREPAVVSASARFAHGVDAHTESNLACGSCRAHLEVGFDPPAPRSRLKIVGRLGTLRIRNFVSPHLGCDFLVEIAGERRIEPTDGASTYDAQLDHLMAVLRGDEQPLTGGRDAIANMVALDAVRAAASIT